MAAAVWSYWRAGNEPASLPKSEGSRLIVDARASGQYRRARELLAVELRSHPESPELQALSADFQESLRPVLEMRYLAGGLMPERRPEPGAPIQLAPNDEFYYSLDLRNMPRESYVYMFLVDSGGQWTVLLPNLDHVSNVNPLPRASYQVPDMLKRRLKPSGTPGVEKVFFVQSWWRIGALEDLAARMSAEKNAGRARSLGQELLARLRLEEAAAPELPGLGYGALEFHSLGNR